MDRGGPETTLVTEELIDSSTKFGSIGDLALPQYQNAPTESTKLQLISLISNFVLTKLCDPIIHICLGPFPPCMAMVRVPETTMDENYFLLRDKD